MKKTAGEYMQQAEQAVLHTYNRFPIVLESGQGVYLKVLRLWGRHCRFRPGIPLSGLR